VAESLFVTLMVAPGLTDKVMGLYMKFEMEIDVPVDEPEETDEPDEPGPADPPPPPKATKRTAPANTRTPVPIRTRRSIVITPPLRSG
jgi:hypothetical protein